MAVPTIAFDDISRDGVMLMARVNSGNVSTFRQGRGDEHRKAFPGSVLKPLVLSALMERGRLQAGETYLCPGRLTVAGRQLNCVHPRVAIAMDPALAVAYSCNGAVAHWAQRITSRDLASSFERLGLQANGSAADVRLLALGEAGLRASAADLLGAYRRCHLPQAVRQGMEGAVEFGTARQAALPHIRVAGKTGSGGTTTGGRVAWFAGFAPSRQPEIFVVVMAAGGSGGADAAPWAHDQMAKYFGARE